MQPSSDGIRGNPETGGRLGNSQAIGLGILAISGRGHGAVWAIVLVASW